MSGCFVALCEIEFIIFFKSFCDYKVPGDKTIYNLIKSPMQTLLNESIPLTSSTYSGNQFSLMSTLTVSATLFLKVPTCLPYLNEHLGPKDVILQYINRNCFILELEFATIS